MVTDFFSSMSSGIIQRDQEDKFTVGMRNALNRLRAWAILAHDSDNDVPCGWVLEYARKQ